MTRWLHSGWRVGLALALLLGAIVLFYELAYYASRSGDGAPLYSIRRHDPYGTAAFYDLLRETNIPVRLLERPTLRKDDRGTLVQVLDLPEESIFHAPPQVQTKPLLEWISQGNTVVQFTRTHTALMTDAGALARTPEAATRPSAAKPTPHQQAQVSKSFLELIEKHERAGRDPLLTPGLPNISVSGVLQPGALDGQVPARACKVELLAPSPLPREGSPVWQPLIVDPQNGRVVVGMARVGLGRLIVVTSPTPVLNDGITQQDNLRFVLALVGSGPVIIDEWSHGLGQGGTVMGFLREVGLLPALLQIILVLALYHWSTRGHERRDPEESQRRRSVVEQVQTLGYLYSNALPMDVVYHRIHQAVVRRMCDAMRCRPIDFQSRVAQLSSQLQQQAQAILDLLKSGERTESPVCPNCRYDLRALTGHRCTECGTLIPLDLMARIGQLQQFKRVDPESTQEIDPIRSDVEPARESARRKAETDLARALTLSHEFAKEVARDRRSIR